MTPLERLPYELLLMILSYLPWADILRVSRANKHMRVIMQGMLPEILRLYPTSERAAFYRQMRDSQFLRDADWPRVLATLPPGFHHAHAVTLPTAVLSHKDVCDAMYEATMLQNCLRVRELMDIYCLLLLSSDVARVLYAEKQDMLQMALEYAKSPRMIDWTAVGSILQWSRVPTSCMRWMSRLCQSMRFRYSNTYNCLKRVLLEGILHKDCVSFGEFRQGCDRALAMVDIKAVLIAGAVNIHRYIDDERREKRVHMSSPLFPLCVKQMPNVRTYVTYGTRHLLETIGIVPTEHPDINPLCATNAETMTWWYTEHARAELCVTYHAIDPIVVVREAVLAHQFDKVSAIIRLSDLNPERDPTVSPIVLTGLADRSVWLGQSHRAALADVIRTYAGFTWLRRYTDIEDATLIAYGYPNPFYIQTGYIAAIRDDTPEIVTMFRKCGIAPNVRVLAACVRWDRLEIFEQIKSYFDTRTIITHGLWPERCGWVHRMILADYVVMEGVTPILPQSMHGYMVSDLERIVATVSPAQLPTGKELLALALTGARFAPLEVVQWIMAKYNLDRNDVPNEPTRADFDCIDWFIREHKVVLSVNMTCFYREQRLRQIIDKTDLKIIQ